METANSFGQTNLHIKENLIIITYMVKDYTSGRMAEVIMEIGTTIKCRELEISNGVISFYTFK